MRRSIVSSSDAVGGKGVDIETAATLLREKLRLSSAVSVSVDEVNGHEAIIVSVEQAKDLYGAFVPKYFEGHPVFVDIRPIAGH